MVFYAYSMLQGGGMCPDHGETLQDRASQGTHTRFQVFGFYAEGIPIDRKFGCVTENSPEKNIDHPFTVPSLVPISYRKDGFQRGSLT